MNAAISGAAGVALVVDHGQLFVLRAGATDALVPTRPEDQRLWLGDARDIQFLQGVTMEEIRRRLVEACDQDEALHLALGLLDPELSNETRVLLASELDAALRDDAVRTFLRNVFYARPWSTENDGAGALRICDEVGAPRARSFFEDLSLLQPVIENVWEAWRAIPDSLMARQDRGWATAAAVREGLFRLIVTAAHQSGDMERLARQVLLRPALRGLPNHEEILRRWVAPLHGSPKGFFLASRPAPAHDRRADPGVEPSGAGDLTDLLAKVEDALRRAPALAAALVARGYGRPGAVDPASDVAGALVKGVVEQVVMDLADLVRTLAKHRDVARDVLWHILPLVGDWEDMLRQARAAGTKHGPLELRLRTETVAEIVIARAEARHYLVAPGDLLPQGAEQAGLPAAALAPSFDARGTGLVDAVLIDLREERRSAEPRLPGEHSEQGIQKRFPSGEDRGIDTDINAGQPQDRRPYLLVVDAELDPRLIEDLDASWAVVQEVLAAALPSLRLVRLNGRIDKERMRARTLYPNSS